MLCMITSCFLFFRMKWRKKFKLSTAVLSFGADKFPACPYKIYTTIKHLN